MELTGLSTDQAPPISAPLRFFLTAPIFAMLAGVLIFTTEAQTLMSRYSYETIAITHALTIGFLGFVMLGALTQMLPVLAGVKIYKVESLTIASYILLVIGLLSMVFGLYFQKQILNFIASGTLTLGFLLLIIPMLFAIKKVVNFTPTVKAMGVSLVFALLSILFGAHLLASHANSNITDSHYIFANIHSVWAIFGFAGLLIIGVAFQVLPMFYVAPRFKQFCKKRVVLLISIGLILWAVTSIFFNSYAVVTKIWIGIFFWAFVTTVWIKLNQRRRPITDVTVLYWRSSSVFLTIGIFAWVFNTFLDDKMIVPVSILIGGGFLISIMIGMLYKIIPFLVWFHLNARGYMNIPTMNEMIDKRVSKIQYILYVLSLIGFTISYFYPKFLELSSLSFILSMILLEYNVINPVLIYSKIIKTKPDFDMSAFGMMQEE
ncbi:MAG: hypothetical protein OQK11_11370 [Thiovulaceae bacterium]|nr:hypothetical protein [Sulfurimonadaceae bacterium]